MDAVLPRPLVSSVLDQVGVPLFVPLVPCVLGGGDRGDVALSYVYANSGCDRVRLIVARVCGQPNWLCVCLVSFFCVCVPLVRVVIICLASIHTALVSSPSSEPACSSPSYLT